MDYCDPCAFPSLLLGLFWDQFWPQLWELFWVPFWALQYELKERGPKLKPKLGPKSGPKSGTTFAKLFAHFFAHAANRCPQWSCPMFCNFRLFSCSRASLHAFCDSREARSYWKKNARKREEAQSVPPAIIVAADIQTVHLATIRITRKI